MYIREKGIASRTRQQRFPRPRRKRVCRWGGAVFSRLTLTVDASLQNSGC